MRLLFEIDIKDYGENEPRCINPTVRGLIIKDGKIAMVRSSKYNYYKFPGGGMEQFESKHDTLIREVKEETGLIVIPSSIREYGLVHRVQKGNREDVLIQDNYYYICDVESKKELQKLDEYEAEEGFTLEFVTPKHAIDINNLSDHGSKALAPRFIVMLERENRVLESLIQENYF